MDQRARKTQRIRNWAAKQYAKQLRHNKHFAKPGPHNFVIVLDNLKPSFNIGKIFRSADAFGCCGVHLIGTEYFITKSAKGSFKWVPAIFHETFADCFRYLVEQDYSLYILDPSAEKELGTVELKPKCGFIFGHEEHGISFDPQDFPSISTIKIPQFGRVRSLNVSIAASVAMYEYVRNYKEKN